uniref:Uncharacterized protein n=1 Tax=Knipowitschia caucasica TaxID=637954 RepID=A0AAV2MSU4_KNICA
MGSGMLDWRLSCLLVQAAVLLLLSEGEKMCPASCRCEGKIVYCESGIFQDVPENITTNCQGLSLRYNNLPGLLPYQFAHLNQLIWLYLDHNSIAAVDALAFHESNKLSSVPVEAVAAWTSLTTVSLAGNSWDCRPSICPLMAWLLTIRDAKDISMICSGPKRAQGERVVDAIRNHSTCPDNVFSTTALLLLHTSTTAKNTTSQFAPSLPPELAIPESTVQILTPPPVFHISTDRKTTKEPIAFTRTTLHFNSEAPTTFIPELQFEHMSFHKIIAGSVALFLSVSLILLVIYVSWRRYPNTMRQLQQHSVNHKKRKKTIKQEQDLNSQLQEYYLSYHSNSETMDSLVNEVRPCTCTVSGSIECEV